MSVAAVIPAAGRGERLGPGAPKALRSVGGQPLLVHAVHAMTSSRSVDVVVVSAPPSQLAATRAVLGPVSLGKLVSVVAGGETRQASVAAALAALPADVDFVLVHDAARPLAPPELADAVVATLREGADAAVPGLPVADTLKQVDPAGRVLCTVDRAAVRAVQTPQGFRREVLEAAHASATDVATDVVTDDAGLVEALGATVLVVPGSEEAFKVTRPMDLLLAEAVLARRRGTA